VLSHMGPRGHLRSYYEIQINTLLYSFHFVLLQYLRFKKWQTLNNFLHSKASWYWFASSDYFAANSHHFVLWNNIILSILLQLLTRYKLELYDHKHWCVNQNEHYTDYLGCCKFCMANSILHGQIYSAWPTLFCMANTFCMANSFCQTLCRF